MGVAWQNQHGFMQPSSAGAREGWGEGYSFPAYPKPFAPLKSRPPPGSRGSALHGVALCWAISVLKCPGFTVYCLRGRKGLTGRVKPPGLTAGRR